MIGELHVGDVVHVVGGQRRYKITEIWLDDHFVAWLKLDNHYVYAFYDVRIPS